MTFFIRWTKETRSICMCKKIIILKFDLFDLTLTFPGIKCRNECTVKCPNRDIWPDLDLTCDLLKKLLKFALTLARISGGDATRRQFFLTARYIFCDRLLIFCIPDFLTFLHKVCKWKVSMTFCCRAMTLLSRSCHGLFDANAHCCGSF